MRVGCLLTRANLFTWKSAMANANEETTLDSKELPVAGIDTLRERHETARNEDIPRENAAKPRKATVRSAVVACASVALATIVIDRSQYSSWWILVAVAVILFLYAETARNIESAFLTEAQNAKSRILVRVNCSFEETTKRYG